MRTTVDIDEDVLRVAKDLAALQEKSIGRVLSDLARKGLMPESPKHKSGKGIPRLPLRPGGRMVTLEDVNRIRDEAD